MGLKKSEVRTLSPRTGRPKAENPKIVDVKVRLDEKTNQELLAFCKENNVTRAEAIRRGILTLLSKEK